MDRYRTVWIVNGYNRVHRVTSVLGWQAGALDQLLRVAVVSERHN
jgi:hypothetical protein